MPQTFGAPPNRGPVHDTLTVMPSCVRVMRRYALCGEVPERLNGPVSKTGVAFSGHREFESPPLRHFSPGPAFSPAFFPCLDGRRRKRVLVKILGE